MQTPDTQDIQYQNAQINQTPDTQDNAQIRQIKSPLIQISNTTDRQAIDSQMTGAIVKREDGPLAEPSAALDL